MRNVEFAHNLGDKVTIVDVGRTATVDSMSLDSFGIQYRVVYWDNGERRVVWVYDWEIRGAGNA